MNSRKFPFDILGISILGLGLFVNIVPASGTNQSSVLATTSNILHDDSSSLREFGSSKISETDVSSSLSVKITADPSSFQSSYALSPSVSNQSVTKFVSHATSPNITISSFLLSTIDSFSPTPSSSSSIFYSTHALSTPFSSLVFSSFSPSFSPYPFSPSPLGFSSNLSLHSSSYYLSLVSSFPSSPSSNVSKSSSSRLSLVHPFNSSSLPNSSYAFPPTLISSPPTRSSSSSLSPSPSFTSPPRASSPFPNTSASTFLSASPSTPLSSYPLPSSTYLPRMSFSVSFLSSSMSLHIPVTLSASSLSSMISLINESSIYAKSDSISSPESVYRNLTDLSSFISMSHQNSTRQSSSVTSFTTNQSGTTSLISRRKTSNTTFYRTSVVTESLSVRTTSGLAISSSKVVVTVTESTGSKTPTLIPKLKEFDGKLVVSIKNKRIKKRSVNDLKEVSDKIERILDDVFKDVEGYVYSKVLKIKRNDQGFLECLFKLFIYIKESTDVTPDALKENISNYNTTKGFGEFTLHSVGTIVQGDNKPTTTACPKTHETLKLWVIIVMTGLGLLCLLLVISVICQRRCIKKLKRDKEYSSSSLGHNNARFEPYPVFDISDTTQNFPLKLRTKPMLSGTDSNKPLKSDITSAGSEADVDEKVSEDGSVSMGSVANPSPGVEQNEKTDVEMQYDTSDGLQIDEITEEDENKCSTFSRKK